MRKDNHTRTDRNAISLITASVLLAIIILLINTAFQAIGFTRWPLDNLPFPFSTWPLILAPILVIVVCYPIFLSKSGFQPPTSEDCYGSRTVLSRYPFADNCGHAAPTCSTCTIRGTTIHDTNSRASRNILAHHTPELALLNPPPHHDLGNHTRHTVSATLIPPIQNRSNTCVVTIGFLIRRGIDFQTSETRT